MLSEEGPRPASGVMTFLFTDIEGSTRRWEADADAMRAALQAHNQGLREALEAHAGHVFNYTGDGMCAVFASPRAAVDAAVAAQRALELPVRMGIATGEAELRGGEYFGTVLNRTARVMAAGHGGRSCSTVRPRLCSAVSTSWRWGTSDYAISLNPSMSFKSKPRACAATSHR